ncbi:SCP-like protein [Ancylostoma ceylanicum]|uniref:SCP-like protein n=1 Tax=Ancylostoma ceylanicum TaxID=53326 RepID=A0A0D6LFL1_9BILA|nr:SCP-like protein [Ancylostoma ceylanicum]
MRLLVLYLLDYQCWNFGQTNEIRHIYLTEANTLREKIAKGEAINKQGKCPQGKNIYKLLANGLATRIGCAQKNCNGKLYMACMVYGKAATTAGQAIYEVGTGCSGDAECTTYEGSRCLKKKKICEAGYPGKEAVVPPTVGTTTAATEKPTEPTKTTKPSKPSSPSKPSKPTASPAGSKYCTEQGHENMNADPAREELWRMHNEKRALVAKGGLHMSNGKTSRACPRMKKFAKYNCGLEKEAYATASNCPKADPNVDNVNWFMATADNRKKAAIEAMNNWYNEINSSYMVQATGSQNLLLPELNIRHFARMVWDTNTEMGCAINKCNNKWVVVCRYGPGVGVYGSPIYFMGPKACNQCRDTCVDGALCPP